MARFTLPRDLYHGKGALEALKAALGEGRLGWDRIDESVRRILRAKLGHLGPL